jgi:mannose-6-phosphate isomerase-like protein (cupin superfamily)
MSRIGLTPGWLAIVCGTIACSSTVPESQYPPPAPRDGLPYIPFAEENEFSEDAEPASAPAEPSAKGPAAIDGALPDSPTLALDRKAACAQKQCELKAWLPDPAFAKSLPAGEPSPAAIWAQEISGGSTLVLPRHHALEVLAIVVGGGLLALGDDGGGRKLAVWDAVRVPGAGVSLKADKDGAKLVLAVSSSKGTLAEALEHAKAKPWEVRWKKRPSAIASSSLKDAKDLAWGGGAFHARIAFGGEYQVPASLETLLAGADAAIAEHDHPGWEHIAVLEGAGTMKLGGANHPVSAGSIFHIPKGVRHAFAPSGSSRLLAVQIYTPSGPEQRFIKLAGEDKAKAPAAPAKAPKK